MDAPLAVVLPGLLGFLALAGVLAACLFGRKSAVSRKQTPASPAPVLHSQSHVAGGPALSIHESPPALALAPFGSSQRDLSTPCHRSTRHSRDLLDAHSRVNNEFLTTTQMTNAVQGFPYGTGDVSGPATQPGSTPPAGQSTSFLADALELPWLRSAPRHLPSNQTNTHTHTLTHMDGENGTTAGSFTGSSFGAPLASHHSLTPGAHHPANPTAHANPHPHPTHHPHHHFPHNMPGSGDSLNRAPSRRGTALIRGLTRDSFLLGNTAGHNPASSGGYMLRTALGRDEPMLPHAEANWPHFIMGNPLQVQVGELLGRGGCGAVYAGCWRGKQVAIKVVQQVMPAAAANATGLGATPSAAGFGAAPSAAGFASAAAAAAGPGPGPAAAAGVTPLIEYFDYSGGKQGAGGPLAGSDLAARFSETASRSAAGDWPPLAQSPTVAAVHHIHDQRHWGQTAGGGPSGRVPYLGDAAASANRLRHPNVLRTYAYATLSTVHSLVAPYEPVRHEHHVVSELCEGGSLRTWLDEQAEALAAEAAVERVSAPALMQHVHALPSPHSRAIPGMWAAAAAGAGTACFGMPGQAAAAGMIPPSPPLVTAASAPAPLAVCGGGADSGRQGTDMDAQGDADGDADGDAGSEQDMSGHGRPHWGSSSPTYRPMGQWTDGRPDGASTRLHGPSFPHPGDSGASMDASATADVASPFGEYEGRLAVAAAAAGALLGAPAAAPAARPAIAPARPPYDVAGGVRSAGEGVAAVPAGGALAAVAGEGAAQGSLLPLAQLSDPSAGSGGHGTPRMSVPLALEPLAAPALAAPLLPPSPAAAVAAAAALAAEPSCPPRPNARRRAGAAGSQRPSLEAASTGDTAAGPGSTAQECDRSGTTGTAGATGGVEAWPADSWQSFKAWARGPQGLGGAAAPDAPAHLPPGPCSADSLPRRPQPLPAIAERANLGSAMAARRVAGRRASNLCAGVGGRLSALTPQPSALQPCAPAAAAAAAAGALASPVTLPLCTLRSGYRRGSYGSGLDALGSVQKVRELAAAWVGGASASACNSPGESAGGGGGGGGLYGGGLLGGGGGSCVGSAAVRHGSGAAHVVSHTYIIWDEREEEERQEDMVEEYNMYAFGRAHTLETLQTVEERSVEGHASSSSRATALTALTALCRRGTTGTTGLDSRSAADISAVASQVLGAASGAVASGPSLGAAAHGQWQQWQGQGHGHSGECTVPAGASSHCLFPSRHPSSLAPCPPSPSPPASLPPAAGSWGVGSASAATASTAAAALAEDGDADAAAAPPRAAAAAISVTSAATAAAPGADADAGANQAIMSKLNKRAMNMVGSILRAAAAASAAATAAAAAQLRPAQAAHLALALECLAEVAAGLSYLHSSGMIHGDIKSGNVLLKRDTRVSKGFELKLADFGFARMLEHGSHTYLSRPSGTLAYLAPELLTAYRQSAAADMYAFGLLVWEVVTAGYLFKGLQAAQMLFAKARNADWEHLSWPAWVPPEVRALATRCTEFAPAARLTAPAAAGQLQQLRRRYGGPAGAPA